MGTTRVKQEEKADTRIIVRGREEADKRKLVKEEEADTSIKVKERSGIEKEE